MLTPEESKVLEHLQRRRSATVEEIARVCLPGAAPGWLDRILANLDWLGYVTVFPGAGRFVLLQITAAGLARTRGRAAAGTR